MKRDEAVMAELRQVPMNLLQPEFGKISRNVIVQKVYSMHKLMSVVLHIFLLHENEMYVELMHLENPAVP